MVAGASNDGLPPAFVDLIEVLDRVADMLAVVRLEAVVIREVEKKIPNKNGTVRTHAQAKKLVKQAKEYLQSGFHARKNQSQSMYLRRLELLVEKIEPHVIGEFTENVIVADLDTNGQQVGKRRMKTRVRKNIFNPAAAQMLMKAYKEIAMLTGGRRGDNAIQVAIDNRSVVLGARATSALSTEDLVRSFASSIGVDVLDVAPALPEPEKPKEEGPEPERGP